MAPQSVDGQEMFVGGQFHYPLQGRSGRDYLPMDKMELIQMCQGDMSA